MTTLLTGSPIHLAYCSYCREVSRLLVLLVAFHERNLLNQHHYLEEWPKYATDLWHLKTELMSWGIWRNINPFVQGLRSASFANMHVEATDVVRQVEAKYPALLFKQQLTAYVEKIYGIVRDNIKKELSSLISLCIQVAYLICSFFTAC